MSPIYRESSNAIGIKKEARIILKPGAHAERNSGLLAIHTISLRDLINKMKYP